MASPRWAMPLFLLASSVFLYSQVFVFPATPRLASGDQSIYLHDAVRMLEGQQIYRDYDHFTLPGTDVLYFVLFRLFGVRASIPSFMLIIVGVAIAWLAVVISQKLMSGPIVFLPGFLFVTLPFSAYLDATHHWYSILSAMAALAVVMEERTAARLALAGLFWACAVWFSQSAVLGVMAMAWFVFWERRRRRGEKSPLAEEASLLASFLVASVALNANFVWKAGVGSFLRDTVFFLIHDYGADRFNTWHIYLRQRPAATGTNLPDLLSWLIVHALVPFLYIVVLTGSSFASKRHPDRPWNRLLLVNGIGFALFLAVASAPAYNRLCTVSAPALIVLVWLLDSSTRLRVRLVPLLWTLGVVLLAVRPVVTQSRWHATLDLPTGRTAFFDRADYAKFAWMAARTRPSDYFFGDQRVNFALLLRNPGRVPFLRPTDYTRPEQVGDLLRQLEVHQVRYVSWYPGLDAPLDQPGNHLGPLVDYLQEHYAVAREFATGDEVWERRR